MQSPFVICPQHIWTCASFDDGLNQKKDLNKGGRKLWEFLADLGFKNLRLSGILLGPWAGCGKFHAYACAFPLSQACFINNTDIYVMSAWPGTYPLWTSRQG